MNKLIKKIALLFVILIFLPISASAQTEIGIRIDADGANFYTRSLADYYRVPQQTVVLVRERGISLDEVPVALYLAQRARVQPIEVVQLRSKGDTWLAIAKHFGLSPEIFYVPVPSDVVGPPYGNAYGYYKKFPRDKWNTIVLADNDIVNLVNLKFVTEYHKIEPAKVIGFRSKGETFLSINSQFDKDKPGKIDKEKSAAADKGKPEKKVSGPGKSDDMHGGHSESHGKHKGKNSGKSKK